MSTPAQGMGPSHTQQGVTAAAQREEALERGGDVGEPASAAHEGGAQLPVTASLGEASVARQASAVAAQQEHWEEAATVLGGQRRTSGAQQPQDEDGHLDVTTPLYGERRGSGSQQAADVRPGLARSAMDAVRRRFSFPANAPPLEPVDVEQGLTPVLQQEEDAVTHHWPVCCGGVAGWRW